MLRTILGILLGFAAMWLVTAGIEFLSHAIYPPPAGLDPGVPEHLQIIIETAPTGALLLLVCAWSAGAFAGGWTAARIARHPRVAATVVAMIVMAGVVGMIVIVPQHPRWVSIMGLLLPVPIALIAAQLAQYREKTLPQ